MLKLGSVVCMYIPHPITFNPSRRSPLLVSVLPPLCLILTQAGGRNESVCGRNLQIAMIWHSICYDRQRNDQVITLACQQNPAIPTPKTGGDGWWKQPSERSQSVRSPKPVGLLHSATPDVRLEPYLHNRNLAVQSCLTCTLSGSWRPTDSLSLRRNQFWGESWKQGSGNFCWPLYLDHNLLRTRGGAQRATEMDEVPQPRWGQRSAPGNMAPDVPGCNWCWSKTHCNLELNFQSIPTTQEAGRGRKFCLSEGK